MSKIASHAHDMRMRLLNPSYDFLWKTVLFLSSVLSLIRLSAVPNKVFVNLLFPQNILPKLFVSLSALVVGFKKWSLGLVPLWHAIFCWFQFSIRFQNINYLKSLVVQLHFSFSHSQFFVLNTGCGTWVALRIFNKTWREETGREWGLFVRVRIAYIRNKLCIFWLTTKKKKNLCSKWLQPVICYR